MGSYVFSPSPYEVAAGDRYVWKRSPAFLNDIPAPRQLERNSAFSDTPRLTHVTRDEAIGLSRGTYVTRTQVASVGVPGGVSVFQAEAVQSFDDSSVLNTVPGFDAVQAATAAALAFNEQAFQDYLASREAAYAAEAVLSDAPSFDPVQPISDAPQIQAVESVSTEVAAPTGCESWINYEFDVATGAFYQIIAHRNDAGGIDLTVNDYSASQYEGPIV